MLPATLLKRFSPELLLRKESVQETLPSGITEVDKLLHGFPRGRISEITGTASSGRTSLLYSLLAASTNRGECCALIDTTNAFFPQSAASSQADLRRILWVRCNGNLQHAFKAVDLILHGGGFGVVALDLCDVSQQIAQRVPTSSWFRFQRIVENTPTVMLVLAKEQQARSSAGLFIETKRKSIAFSGTFPYQILHDVDYQVTPRKPMQNASADYKAIAV